MKTLRDYGYRFIEPGKDIWLAATWEAAAWKNRKKSLLLWTDFRSQTGILKGKKVVVMAGAPGRKLIRSVSSAITQRGKMGYAIAEEAVLQGAEVTLISGPVSLAPPQGVTLISVESAEEMYEAVMKVFLQSDLVVKTAAVADYRP